MGIVDLGQILAMIILCCCMDRVCPEILTYPSFSCSMFYQKTITVAETPGAESETAAHPTGVTDRTLAALWVQFGWCLEQPSGVPVEVASTL